MRSPVVLSFRVLATVQQYNNGLVGMVGMGQLLDLVIPEVFSNLSHSAVLGMGMVGMGQPLDLMIVEVFSNPEGSTNSLQPEPAVCHSSTNAPERIRTYQLS